MSWLTSFVDDVLGIDPPKAPKPAPAPAVATTLPATNTPTPAPAPVQTSFDRAQSYLAMQSQIAFSKQLKELTTGASVSAPLTFSQTEQGQKMIKLSIIAAIAWLFLFKG